MNNELKSQIENLIRDEFPELFSLFNSEEFSFEKAMDILQDNPEMSNKLCEKIVFSEGYLDFLGQKANASNSQELVKFEEVEIDDFRPEDVLGDKNVLSPVYEALLRERLQFDGDAPELRTDHARQVFDPAVTVNLETSSMLALGAAISSEESVIRQDLENCYNKTLELRGDLSDEAIVKMDYDDLPVITSKKYTHGAIQTKNVSDVSVLGLTKSKKKQLVWKALSSTQGRNSASLSLANLIGSDLTKKGFDVSSSRVRDESANTYYWTMTLDAEVSTQPSFNHIGVARGVFVSKLCKVMDTESSYVFEVSSVNNISERLIGWKVKLKKSN